MVAEFSDGTGVIELVWFKGIKWVKPKLQYGVDYVVFGKPSRFKNKFNLVHPEFETVEAQKKRVSNDLIAVYPSTENAKDKNLDSKGWQLDDTLVSQLKGQGQVAKLYGPEFRQKNHLMPRGLAFINVHFPQDPDTLKKARFRLKFDELFFIQLRLLKLKLLKSDQVSRSSFWRSWGVGKSVLFRMFAVRSNGSTETCCT